MAKIAAFIGHSFADANKDVVREFLEFFNHVKDTLDDFTWEHAEPAEPKVLSEKVKNLTTDKNIFIGICTAKEKVIASEELKQGVSKYPPAEPGALNV